VAIYFLPIGSFRVLQRAALRATTAAPTYFKPVQMGADMYSDGGLIASNPAAVAIHEARTLYPDIPIEMVVSVGTGEFVSEEVKSSFGWVSRSLV
jgi:patatin-like phospholipase/acyl hydrolase